MSRKSLTYPVLGALMLAALAACSDTLGLNATGEVRLALGKLSDPLVAFPPSNDTAATQRAVMPDTVASFKVTVTAIQLLEAGSDSSDASPGWTNVQLSAPIDVDLMALPSGSDSLIATGHVAAGSYSMVRLFVTNPRIRFKGAVDFGLGGILQGGVDYTVTIPSAAQSGIKVAGGVTVQANASASSSASNQVNLAFDQRATLGNVTFTGSGTIIVQAVLRSN